MPSTEFATRKRIELTDSVESPAAPASTNTEAVGRDLLSPSKSLFSGMTTITRAARTPLSWLIVRVSSPWMARR